ncbi:unnamed protein product [Ilex paraguariensis]|uniref:Uncharacterized protein n=1 Tax=Ilex paraguariensis TaxID=185542 RepID=A0ABC8TE38_9AQUA
MYLLDPTISCFLPIKLLLTADRPNSHYCVPTCKPGASPKVGRAELAHSPMPWNKTQSLGDVTNSKVEVNSEP